MRSPYLILFVLVFCSLKLAVGQCDDMPVVTGDTILCPNGQGTLLTASEFDSYQWYRRGFSDTARQAIDGATSRSISIDAENDGLFYFSVEVTYDTCTTFSKEVLVDVYAFLLPVVSSTGDFEVDNMGNSVICEGDTMYFTLLPPYDTSITWFMDGMPISGEDDSILTVTMAGDYTVQGAPSECPEYIQSLGVTLTVIEEDCSSSIDDNFANLVTVFPNPAGNYFMIEGLSALEGIFIFNINGQLVKNWTDPRSKNKFDITDLGPGSYIIEIRKDGKSIYKKLIVE